MSNDFEYVFYTYGDNKYGFWILMDNGTAMSLFENTPENGMWLDPADDGSEYNQVKPSDTLRELVGRLVAQETVDMAPYQSALEPWESHFVSVIHGTINQESPDNIPGLVWDWMHDCREELDND